MQNDHVADDLAYSQNWWRRQLCKPTSLLTSVLCSANRFIDCHGSGLIRHSSIWESISLNLNPYQTYDYDDIISYRYSHVPTCELENGQGWIKFFIRHLIRKKNRFSTVFHQSRDCKWSKTPISTSSLQMPNWTKLITSQRLYSCDQDAFGPPTANRARPIDGRHHFQSVTS